MRSGAAAAPTAASEARRHPRSWIDWLVQEIEQLPGPAWLVYLVLGLIGLVAGNAIPWLAGKPAEIDLTWSVFGIFPVAELALIGHLDRVADEALVRVRPLTGATDAEFADLRLRLVSAPAGFAGLFTVAAIAGSLASDMIDPSAHRLSGLPILAAGLTVAIEVVVTALLAAFVLKAVRRFLEVDRIHREAPRIDLFDPPPLYAFSRLTSQTAIGLLFIAGVLIPQFAPTYLESGTALTRFNFASFIGTLIVAATAMFVLPLYGMHRRIVLEKDRLQTASGSRLAAVLHELDRDVAGLDLERADGLNKLLASVLAERDLLARLPTWPWQATTLRGFLSALLLPVVVYLLARAAERIVL